MSYSFVSFDFGLVRFLPAVEGGERELYLFDLKDSFFVFGETAKV